jgi:hypothetical protein
MVEKENNSKQIFFFKKAIMTIWKKKLWKDGIGKGKKRRKSTQLDLTWSSMINI